MREQVIIPFKNKVVKLLFNEFDEEVDIDQLTFIDYSNIHAEFLTISSLYNRVGLWRAEAESALSEAKLQINIKSAEKAEYYRVKLKEVTGDKVKWPTIAQVDNAVSLDQEIIELQKREIRLQRDLGYIDSLFWAVKSKEKKIDKLIEGAKLTPDDFEREIVEGKWNGIMIRCQEKLVKG